MPEKTLKEKVEEAKGRLDCIYDRYTRERVSEALTALEDRVEELEVELALQESKVYQKEAPDGE